MDTLEASVRQLRMVHTVLLLTIGLYAVAGEIVEIARPGELNPVARMAITLVAAAQVAALVVARRVMLAPAAEQLHRDLNDAAALARWRAGNFLTMVFCEVVALFGLVLRLLGEPLTYAGVFYLAGAALLLAFAPRHPGR